MISKNDIDEIYNIYSNRVSILDSPTIRINNPMGYIYNSVITKHLPNIDVLYSENEMQNKSSSSFANRGKLFH